MSTPTVNDGTQASSNPFLIRAYPAQNRTSPAIPFHRKSETPISEESPSCCTLHRQRTTISTQDQQRQRGRKNPARRHHAQAHTHAALNVISVDASTETTLLDESAPPGCCWPRAYHFLRRSTSHTRLTWLPPSPPPPPFDVLQYRASRHRK